ncbi:PREDICTED: spermatogenesis-associated protein 22 [Chrysochloris asiatica]|uniref:Spermatogenesis-associated protein 22 n=1 Tax=Chrysochloris asiatica TaxID=185453 RepID=A0A9B0TF61_CHRAS|nr:PREDICTED: spermatogenesis-associated protein 22 [Chrysochloris asiatica]
MKRNVNENPTRSTAGCLPVPLFNQKKRNRQPLTSNPLKNDPGISTASDSYDFPPLPTDWAWETMNPELPPLSKTMNTGQMPHSVSRPLRSQDPTSKLIQSDIERNQCGWSSRDGNKNINLKTWERDNFKPQCKRTNLLSSDGINSCSMSLGAQQKQLRLLNTPTTTTKHSSNVSYSTMRAKDSNSTLQGLKSKFQQNQFKKKMLDDTPEDNTLKEAPLYELKFKEKDNSLRIISVVIESMKYWREHAQKAILLFEILAVLDSAVTPGPYFSKTFLMRDGKNTLPCIFYEIDRELPRLIRGRVHRCVGNYDQKNNIFKCVSVRPASVSEQKTFQEFVKIVDVEMKYYTNVINEV